jgi:hypothetical protein
MEHNVEPNTQLRHARQGENGPSAARAIPETPWQTIQFGKTTALHDDEKMLAA